MFRASPGVPGLSGTNMNDSRPSPRRQEAPSLPESGVTQALVRRLGLARLVTERPLRAAFVFACGFVTIGLLAGIAVISRAPFIFPSLGPTAFLLFFTPTLPTASPRNTLYGHAIGILCGYSSLWICGLAHAPAVTVAGVDGHRALAAALSLASTGALMILLGAPHPPAGATTLIISLGILTKPLHLVTIEIAVAVLTLQAIAINRLAGIKYPLWRQPPHDY